MAGAELVLDVAVVARTHVLVDDKETDGGSRGQPLEHARQDLHAVGFAALAGMARLAGAAAVQVHLDVVFDQGDARRHAIDDAADGRAMAFTEGGEAEQMAEGVGGHVYTVEMSGASAAFMPTML